MNLLKKIAYVFRPTSGYGHHGGKPDFVKEMERLKITKFGEMYKHIMSSGKRLEG